MDWMGGADQVKGMFVRPEQIAEIGKQEQSDDAERKRPHLVRLCTRRPGHCNYRSSAITLAVIRQRAGANLFGITRRTSSRRRLAASSLRRPPLGRLRLFVTRSGEMYPASFVLAVAQHFLTI